MIEAIGYLAMAFTVGSFLAKEMPTLRMLNMAGCFWWIIYGIGTAAAPVIVVNVIIMVINLIHFIKIYRDGE
jgi:hypothetical protein